MSNWKHILRSNFRDVDCLADFLKLDRNLFSSSPFPLNLPMRLASKMVKGTLLDPILRQFVPLKEEENVVGTENPDPLSEQLFHKAPCLLQKYSSRALLHTTSACCMHCRFCFRKCSVWDEGAASFDEEIKYLKGACDIQELILSGGDPLSLSNDALGGLLASLSEIPHLRRIRIHSRFPVGIPERIDSGLLSLFAHCPKQLYFVLHTNHPRELDEDVFAALKAMQRLAIPLLSQSVLLKGVNDEVEVLEELFVILSDHGIVPYYLHQLDPAPGTSHFAVAESKGISLLKILATKVSGYTLPRYVKEIPGQSSKVEIKL